MVTRFAPSPTGYLHLGHVVNAIYVWGVARAAGGRVLLRLENHDRIRSRAEYDSAIRDDLAWLGFAADAGPWRQDDDSPYEEAIERLRQVGHVYACDCSRKVVGGEHYPGHCRARRLAPGPGRGLRVVIEPGGEAFTDLRLGRQRQEPAAQCGDLLLRDRDGNWTYQLAVTVDDLRQGVTHVIRGEDLLDSTGRQIRLARMLGRLQPPTYLHHPLIVKAGGEKLSKASGDSGVRELRAAGLQPAEVLGLAAAAVGLLERPAPLSVSATGELMRSYGVVLRRTY